MDRHPGGREYLLLAAGRDCTDLFTSYHPFTEKPGAYLKQFAIGRLATEEFPAYKPDGGFYASLRKQVGEYFERTGLDPKSPWPGLWRMALVLLVAAGCYAVMNALVAAPWLVRIAAAVVFGICQALPLLHVMHDSSHSAIGHSETWWRALGQFFMEWYAGAHMHNW